ncbi:MAG: hypothetical protein V1777_01390 [Candidatus Micrarchaeota archaeon]
MNGETLGLRDLYYGLEDGYYAILDKIQRLIPIYSIIDPIDRVFPSFILFILLAILLIGAGVFLIFQNQAPAAGYNAGILLLDDLDKPLQNVDITVKIGEASTDYSTNANGKISVLLLTPTAHATVSIAATGFKPVVDKPVELDSAKEAITIKLIKDSGPASLDVDFTIKLVNSQDNTPIDDATVNVTFHCSQSTASPPTPANLPTTTGTIVVKRLSACGTLSADFSPVNTYQSKANQLIISNPTTVALDPIRTEPQVGTVRVTVTDANTNARLRNVRISYWDASNSADVHAGPDTDTNGRSLITNVPIGFYKLSGFAADGRNQQTPSSFEVKKNQTAEVALALPALSNAKKLFFKVVDKNSQEALGSVTVRLYDHSSLFPGNGSSNDAGIVEQYVDKKWDSAFSAVLYKQGFLITVKDLVALDANATIPTIVELERAITTSAGVPVNYGIALVKTVSEDDPPVPVPSSHVTLYRSDYSNPLFTTDTNTGGQIMIYNVAPSTSTQTYFVTATKTELDAAGQSGNNPIIAGVKSEFIVRMFVATGDFEITAVDAANTNQLLSGAGVTALVKDNSSNFVFLKSCTTGSTGKCKIEDIKTNKILRFDVNKNNYLTFHSAELHTDKDQTKAVQARLTYSTKRPGDACSATDICPSPMACTDSVCVQTCATNSECYSVFSGYYCSTAHICELAPFNTCDSNSDCVAPQWCNLNFGLCAEPEGQACTSNSQCGHLVCDSVSHQCTDPTGNACTPEGSTCGSPEFICTNGLCGRTCSANSDCQAGFVCNTASHTCENPGNPTEIEYKYIELLGDDGRTLDAGHLMKAGTSYQAVFDLVLHEATVWKDVYMHVRAGKDSVLTASDNNVWITNVTLIDGGSGQALFSTTTDLGDIYSDPDGDIVSSIYKQVNSKYDSLASGTYVMWVKFETRGGLAQGTPIELHFQAKGIEKIGSDESNWSTPAHQKNFEIGGSTCNHDCPPFAWQFFLNSLSSPALNPGEATPISENGSYSLFYVLRNQSSDSFSSATVRAVSPETGSLILMTPYAASGSLSSQSASQLGIQNPVLFSTASVEDGGLSANMDFSLETVPLSTDETTNQSVLFQVDSGKQLSISVWQVAEDRFEIRVKDPVTNLPVAGALVRAKFKYCNEDEYRTAAFGSAELPWSIDRPDARTGTDGRFRDATMTSQSVGACIVVEAEKSSYHTTRHFDMTGIDIAFGDPVSCITVDLDTVSPGQQKRRDAVRGATELPFTITSGTDCVKTFKINLGMQFGLIKELNAITLTNVGDDTTPIDLAPGETIDGTATIAPDSPLGYLPISLTIFDSGTSQVQSRQIAGEYVINDAAKTYNITEVIP